MNFRGRARFIRQLCQEFSRSASSTLYVINLEFWNSIPGMILADDSDNETQPTVISSGGFSLPAGEALPL